MLERTGSEPLMPTHPVLDQWLHCVELDGSCVQLCNATQRYVIECEQDAHATIAMLHDMNGRASVTELMERHGGTVFLDLLRALVKMGVVSDAGKAMSADLETVARTARAAAPTVPVANAIENLSTASVTIAGGGAIGMAVATSLTDCALRALVVQGGVCVGDKAGCAPCHFQCSTWLFTIDPQIRKGPDGSSVRCRPRHGNSTSCAWCWEPDAQRALPRSTRLLIVDLGPDGCGSFANLIALARQRNIPYLGYSQDGPLAVLGPVVCGNGEACHVCIELRRRSHMTTLREHLAYRDYQRSKELHSEVTAAPHTDLLAGWVASEALRIIAGAPPTLRGRVLEVDLSSLCMKVTDVRPVAGCPACSAGELT